jgi:hypothetical protein
MSEGKGGEAMEPLREVALDEEELRGVDVLFSQGVEWIGELVEIVMTDSADGCPSLDTSTLPALVRRFVDEKRAGRGRNVDTEQLAYSVGTVWAEAFVGKLGWRWCKFEVDGSTNYAITSADGAYAMLPHHYIYRLLMKPESDNTAALVFNMVAAGDFPPSKPHAYTMLG